MGQDGERNLGNRALRFEDFGGYTSTQNGNYQGYNPAELSIEQQNVVTGITGGQGQIQDYNSMQIKPDPRVPHISGTANQAPMGRGGLQPTTSQLLAGPGSRYSLTKIPSGQYNFGFGGKGEAGLITQTELYQGLRYHTDRPINPGGILPPASMGSVDFSIVDNRRRYRHGARLNDPAVLNPDLVIPPDQ